MLSLKVAAAAKHSIDTGAGVIDADYRGKVFALLFNLSDVDFTGWCDVLSSLTKFTRFPYSGRRR